MHKSYDLAGLVIGCGIEVHKLLGPGLLESTYHRCLGREMTLQGIPFVEQKPMSIIYKNELIKSAYIPDFIVGDRLIVEVKAVVKLADIHKQQIMTYMKLSGCTLGLLINFNVMMLTHGIKRVSYR